MYSDEVFVTFCDIQPHVEIRDRLLTKFCENILRVKLTNGKCLRETDDFLAFEICPDGTQPLASKVKIMICINQPMDYKEP